MAESILCTNPLKGTMKTSPTRGGQLLKEAAVFGPQLGKATRADSTMGPQVPHTVSCTRLRRENTASTQNLVL